MTGDTRGVELASEAAWGLMDPLWLTSAAGAIEWRNDAALGLNPHANRAEDESELSKLFSEVTGFCFGEVQRELDRVGTVGGYGRGKTSGSGTEWFRIDISPRPKSPGWVVRARRLLGWERAEQAGMRLDEVLFRELGRAVGLWRSDTTTDEVTWSQRTYELMGVARGTRLHQGSFFLSVHESDRARIAEAAAKSIAEHVAYDVTFRTAASPDAEPRWVEATGVAILDDDGRPLQYLGTAADATRRVLMEHRVAELEAQLQRSQRLEAVGTLVSGIAHDFNNLLTVIGGHAELLRVQLPADSGGYDNISAIVEASQRSSELTRQLLSFGRRQVFRPEPLRFADAVRQSLRMLRRLIPEEVAIQTTDDSEGAVVFADRGQLHQILLNLVTNAAQVMPAGGTLTVACCVQEGMACLIVYDTGPGVPVNDQARIFDPFFTTRDGGTGLGLSTARDIARRHGGELVLDATDDTGARFVVTLPVTSGCPTLEKREPEPPRGRGQHILVAEDQMLVRQLAVGILNGAGYAVTEASNIRDALAKYHAEPDIALLLTDVIMPGGSGALLARQILETNPTLPVLYMSGYEGDFLSQRGVGAAESQVVAKPFTSTSLLRQVARALRCGARTADDASPS